MQARTARGCPLCCPHCSGAFCHPAPRPAPTLHSPFLSCPESLAPPRSIPEHPVSEALFNFVAAWGVSAGCVHGGLARGQHEVWHGVDQGLHGWADVCGWVAIPSAGQISNLATHPSCNLLLLPGGPVCHLLLLLHPQQQTQFLWAAPKHAHTATWALQVMFLPVLLTERKCQRVRVVGCLSPLI